MVDNSLEDIQRKSLPNAQSGIRSVVFNVVQDMIFGLLRKDLTAETLDAHIAKSLEPDTAIDGLSRRLLISIQFMTHIGTLMRRKRDSEIEEKKHRTAFASKQRPDAVQIMKGDRESPSSRSEFEPNEAPLR